MLNYVLRRLGYGFLTILGGLGLLFLLFYTVIKPDDIERND